MTETLSGSVTITRVKKGVNVVLTIATENAPLYQGYNPSTGEVKPSFKTAANQPVLVPTVTATNKKTASINTYHWYYNNSSSPLVETAVECESGEGFMLCTDARFAINPTNHKLRIVGDIASEGNTSNDLLTFECEGEVQGTAYQTKGSAELHLQTIGTSAVDLSFLVSSTQLSNASPSAKLTAVLSIDSETKTTGYTFKFFNESFETLQEGTENVFTVKREHVTSTGGVYCSVWRSDDTSKTILATKFQEFIDVDDEKELFGSVEPLEWDGSTKQTVTAHLVNADTKEEETNLKGTFQHLFKSSSTLTSCGTKEGQSVEIDNDVWDKVPSNEELIDFISYSY